MRLIKLCPSCGSEFVHTVETCVDCGATLQVADPLSVDRSATSAGPPPEDVVWLRTADPAWVRQLAGLLEEAEIPYFIELVDQGQGPFFMAAGWLYALGVRPEDEAIARKLDAYLYDQQVVGPEGADGPNLEDTTTPAPPAASAWPPPAAPAASAAWSSRARKRCRRAFDQRGCEPKSKGRSGPPPAPTDFEPGLLVRLQGLHAPHGQSAPLRPAPLRLAGRPPGLCSGGDRAQGRGRGQEPEPLQAFATTTLTLPPEVPGTHSAAAPRTAGSSRPHRSRSPNGPSASAGVYRYLGGGRFEDRARDVNLDGQYSSWAYGPDWTGDGRDEIVI